MKIDSVETFLDGHAALVRVGTDDGAQGWGQLPPANADIAAAVLHRQVAPVVLGSDDADLDAMSDAVIEATCKFPGSYVCRALAGVDTALWDLRARRAGVSVRDLLGGTRTHVPCYASSMRRDITPQEEAERMVKQCARHGFGAVKLKIGRRNGHDEDQWPGRTAELVSRVRRELPAEVAILVDANGGYTPAGAIEVGRMLEAHGVGHFEEPCPWWEVEWTAAVAAALEMPVAGGEQDFHLPTWRRIFELRAVDIAQPDVLYVGGLTRCLRVARMAAEGGLPCVPHSSNRSLQQVFTMHLLASIPNAVHMEYSIEPAAWTQDLFEPVPVVGDGQVEVPTGPGWGVTINPDVLERAQHQVSRR